MLMVLVTMVIGYAVFQTQLKINGIGSITSEWGITITNITFASTGNAYNISSPVHTDTSLNFKVGLKVPGDKMTFTVTVKNRGTIDAILTNIDAKANGSYMISYSISGIQAQTRFAAAESKTFTITVEFNRNATSIPNDTEKEILINLNYVQDDGQPLIPEFPKIEEQTLASRILRDNLLQNEPLNLDMTENSSIEGDGLFYTVTNTQEGRGVYFFRGAVENNYVNFAGKLWRIIRINEDGTIRLMTQDIINQGIYDELMLVYMSGPITTNAKDTLDAWYESNLSSYSFYIADAGFCNEMNITLVDRPQFMCRHKDYFFTVNSDKGNKLLTYPIGLITVDEAIYAGGRFMMGNSNTYLNNNSVYWTMSPYGSSVMYAVHVEGILERRNIKENAGFRPVISLNSNVLVKSGNGTNSNPYVIKTS